MSVNVFFTGATGFIGGPVLLRLVAEKVKTILLFFYFIFYFFSFLFLSFHFIDLLFQKYNIAALVRSEEKGKLLAEIGVRPVIGDLNSKEIIQQEVIIADIVVNLADCDHLPR